MHHLQYLEENLGVANVELTPADLREVRDVAQKADAAQGDRSIGNGPVAIRGHPGAEMKMYLNVQWLCTALEISSTLQC